MGGGVKLHPPHHKEFRKHTFLLEVTIGVKPPTPMARSKPAATTHKGRQLCKYFQGHGIFMGRIQMVWAQKSGREMAFVKYTDGDSEGMPLVKALGMPSQPRKRLSRKQRHPRRALMQL